MIRPNRLLFLFLVLLLSCSPEYEYGTVTDTDGNTYKTIVIGNQEWMAENLEVTHYRNSQAIPHITDSAAWVNATTGAWCDYDNNPAIGAEYSKLYNWYAVNDTAGLCPEGWHIPTDEEWKTLEIFVGMDSSYLDQLSGYRGLNQHLLSALLMVHPNDWDLSIVDINNTTGLGVIASGNRRDGRFGGLHYSATFWTNSDVWDYPQHAYYRLMYSHLDAITRNFDLKTYGYSCRCVKD